MTELVKGKMRELLGEHTLVTLGVLAYIVAGVGLAVSVGASYGAPAGWLVALLGAAVPLMLRQAWKVKHAQLDAVRRVDQAMGRPAQSSSAGPAPEPLVPPPPAF